MPNHGWFRNERNELEIDYYSGSPYPTSIADMTSDKVSNDGDNFDDEEEDDKLIYDSTDDEEENEEFDDNDWYPEQ